MKDILHNKWFRFGFWGLLYLAWVIWLGNYWWLLGLPVIFDHHITRKVKWLFWKKNYQEGEKRNVWLDWFDALIFAVVVVTFVNIFFVQAYKIPTSSMEGTLLTGDHLFVGKVAYGPKIAERPLSFPFVHNALPFTGGKSWSDLIRRDYRRLAGFSQVQRDDIVVFGFPHGDTVLSQDRSADYYTFVRHYGKEFTERNYGPLLIRPRDKKDNYVKRCVAVAGDTLEIRAAQVYVNGQPQPYISGVQNSYTVTTNGSAINPKLLEKLELNPEEYWYNPTLPGYETLPLNAKQLEEVADFGNVVDIRLNEDIYDASRRESQLLIFPFSEHYPWTRDNYGPLWIPAKGDTITLNLENLPLYRRIISVYEENELDVVDGVIYINGEPADRYVFSQNYYFMMGDNRHNSLDSRYWGFVPEDHIVGKPRVIWFSVDKHKPFPRNIRWKRMFKFV